MRKPLGTLDTFSRVYRPSRTAHLMLSSLELVTKLQEGSVTLSSQLSAEA
jgi:hypothetical protein